MRTLINPCNIYLSLWSLRYLWGIVIDFGPLPSAVISFLLIVFTLYYTAKAMFEIRLPRCLKSLLLFGIVLLLYGVCLMMKGDVIGTAVSDWTYTGLKFFRDTLSSIFPVFVLYYFNKNGLVTHRVLQIWSIIFFCIATIIYFYQRASMAALIESFEVKREGFTNNAAYTIVAIIPLILYISRSKLIQLISFAFCLYLIFIGVKRGAILIASLIFLYYAVVTFKNSKQLVKIRYVVLMFCFIIFAFYVFHNYLMTNEYFLSRLADTKAGSVSGRDSIIQRLLNAYCKFGIIEIIFGTGAYGTLKIIGQFAHNDWVEILICQGLVGVVLYMVYYLRLFGFIVKNKSNSTAWHSLVMVFIILLFKTLFSMSYSDIDIWLNMVLAYNIYIIKYQHEDLNCDSTVSD